MCASGADRSRSSECLLPPGPGERSGASGAAAVTERVRGALSARRAPPRRGLRRANVIPGPELTRVYARGYVYIFVVCPPPRRGRSSSSSRRRASRPRLSDTLRLMDSTGGTVAAARPARARCAAGIHDGGDARAAQVHERAQGGRAGALCYCFSHACPVGDAMYSVGSRRKNVRRACRSTHCRRARPRRNIRLRS